MMLMRAMLFAAAVTTVAAQHGGLTHILDAGPPTASRCSEWKLVSSGGGSR